MYKQGLISSPNLSNDQLVTEAKAALRKMKLQLLQGQLQLTTGTASAYTQFDAAQKQLEKGWAEYHDGQTSWKNPAPSTRAGKPRQSRSWRTALPS
mgnify:FL=1